MANITIITVGTLKEGYLKDAVAEYKKRLSQYARVDEVNIKEEKILEWARNQTIFNHFYETQKRCGCMYCPMSAYITYAYLYKYYPNNFSYMMDKMRETEKIREAELGRPFSVISSNPKYNADYLENIIKIKWLKILNDRENEITGGINYA